MAAADVGDDVFADDPTVLALQERVASLFGHEAALFTPSGSMANQIAVHLLVPPGEELICDADAHLVTYELGAAAWLSGISSRTWPAAGAEINPESVAQMLRPAGYFQVPTRVVAVEQTHNLAAGSVIPMSTLESLRQIATSGNAALHCDGARIWHAHVATGVPLDAYGRLFDTLSVCLSKGLGAPVGSLVIGSAALIERARWIRKRMGGGMRQVGILAAAGLYALDHHVDRLAEDHERARRLAAALEPWSRWGGTNLVYLDLTKADLDSPDLVARARAEGVLISAIAPRQARLITHLDVDDSGVDRAVEVLLRLLGAP